MLSDFRLEIFALELNWHPPDIGHVTFNGFMFSYFTLKILADTQVPSTGLCGNCSYYFGKINFLFSSHFFDKTVGDRIGKMSPAASKISLLLTLTPTLALYHIQDVHVMNTW